MIPGSAIAIAAVAGAIALIASGELWLGILVLVAGLGLAAMVILVSEGIALARSVWNWVALVRSKPDSVRVVSVEPPKGFLFRRDAVVTLDVSGGEGRRETLEHEIRIPWLQAILWRLAGRVPTPIGRLTDKRDLNATVWSRDRGDQPAGV
jgi:hypothetical protein